MALRILATLDVNRDFCEMLDIKFEKDIPNLLLLYLVNLNILSLNFNNFFYFFTKFFIFIIY